MIRTTNVFIYSLRTAVIVVQQQVPWGASLLRPRPQKPRLPRGLRLERAAVAVLRRATMLRIALNRLFDVPRVDIELQHGSSGEVEFPLRIYSNKLLFQISESRTFGLCFQPYSAGKFSIINKVRISLVPLTPVGYKPPGLTVGTKFIFY